MYKKNLYFGNVGRIGLLAGLIVMGCGGIISNAFAVGMGSASVESFIGEELDISIPIVNVDGSENLTLELDQNSVSLLGDSPLKVELVEDGDQLIARVSSDFTVTEPYLSFSLNLSDNKSRSAKQFTVLLDLAPIEKAAKNAEAAKRAVIGSSITTSKASQTGQRGGKSVARYTSPSGNASRRNSGKLISGSRLVTPGQTLWGIARQASKGTGVSINQMMVAIYQNNSSAFANGSIDLLKAGSSIDIPNFESATQINNNSATQRMQELSGQRTVRKNVAVAVTTRLDEDSLLAEGSSSAEGSLPAEGSSLAEGSLSAEGSLPVEGDILNDMFSAEDLEDQFPDQIDDGLVRSDGGQSAAFTLTGIAQAADGSSIGLQSSSDPQTQEVIDSLAATVGNLTQDIIAKDKQVQFLEDRIKALERFQSQEIAQANSVTSSIAASGPNPAKSKLWWLLPLGMLALLALFFRDWIGARFQSSSSNDDQFEHYDAQTPKARLEPAEVFRNERDYSVLSSREKTEDDDGVDGVFIEIESSEYDDDIDLEVVATVDEKIVEDVFAGEDETLEVESLEELESEHSMEFTISGDSEADDIYEIDNAGKGQAVDFNDRLERLLEEHDYDFARNLLDSARNSEISEDRYHFEQLRLFFAMDDVRGFQQYYDEIEPQLETFDKDVVAGIKGLVSSIKQ